MILKPQTHELRVPPDHPDGQHRNVTRAHCFRLTMDQFLSDVSTPVELSVDRASQETDYAKQKRVRPETRKAWFGGVTMAEALAMARTGWAKGAADVARMSAAISAPLFSQAEKTTNFDVAPGEWIDQDRFLTGTPEVWGEIADTDVVVGNRRGRFVHIVVNGGLACSQCSSMNCMTEPVSPATLLNRGAMICSLADVMEAMGFRSKITVVYCCHSIADSGRQKIAISLPLKDYGGHLDMDSLMYFLGHPSALRRLAFSYLEHMPSAIIKAFNIQNQGGEPGTYGMLSDTIPEELGIYDERDACVYIPYVKGNPPEFRTMEAARAELVSILRKQGVMVEAC